MYSYTPPKYHSSYNIKCSYDNIHSVIILYTVYSFIHLPTHLILNIIRSSREFELEDILELPMQKYINIHCTYLYN